VPRPAVLGTKTPKGEITIPNVPRQISSCCRLCRLVFLQQPIIFKKCDRVLQLERLTELLEDRPSGAVPPSDDAIHPVPYRTVFEC
jgi:hypothetical protein